LQKAQTVASVQLWNIFNNKELCPEFFYESRGLDGSTSLNPQVIEKADSIYYGQFNIKTNQPQGKGVQFGRLHLVQGHFGDDRGRIRILWADDGDTYTGQFSEGKKNGFGIYRYSEQDSRYIGYWEEDVKKGYGQDISNTSGEMLRGIWNDNELIMPDTEKDKQGDAIKRQRLS
jgi:hypothetical protein